MKSLPRSEALKLDAAEGWLMLGNAMEADAEVESIGPEYRFHPLVLGMRWEVYSALHWWEVAWVVSRFLCQKEPDHSAFWICQADSLRHVQGVKAARDLLSSVVSRFQNDPVISYNLACYACQLGEMGEACKWLLRAFRHDSSADLKLMALRDTDLSPLWTRIEASVLLSFESHSAAFSD